MHKYNLLRGGLELHEAKTTHRQNSLYLLWNVPAVYIQPEHQHMSMMCHKLYSIFLTGISQLDPPSCRIL